MLVESDSFIPDVTFLRGSFHKQVTKQRHSISFPNIKNQKYTFCREFNSEYQLWVLLRWRHCDVIYKTLNMATLPLKSSRNEHPPYSPDFSQWLSSFWANEENARWGDLIRYQGAISLSVARTATAASIVLCIGHSEACWQMGQMFKRTWTICWKMKH